MQPGPLTSHCRDTVPAADAGRRLAWRMVVPVRKEMLLSRKGWFRGCGLYEWMGMPLRCGGCKHLPGLRRGSRRRSSVAAGARQARQQQRQQRCSSRCSGKGSSGVLQGSSTQGWGVDVAAFKEYGLL